MAALLGHEEQVDKAVAALEQPYKTGELAILRSIYRLLGRPHKAAAFGEALVAKHGPDQVRTRVMGVEPDLIELAAIYAAEHHFESARQRLSQVNVDRTRVWFKRYAGLGYVLASAPSTNHRRSQNHRVEGAARVIPVVGIRRGFAQRSARFVSIGL